METPKSLSFKSTRFLILSLSLAFSLFLLSLFSSSAMNATLSLYHNPQLLFYSTQYSTEPTTNSSVYSSNLTDTQFRKDLYSASFGRDLTVYRVNGSDLVDTLVRKDRNSSGFVGISIQEGVERKGNQSQLSEVGAGFAKFGNGGPQVSGKVKGKKKRECDIYRGKWVYDESYPLYTNSSCPFIDEGFNCQGNGRLDKDYMKWRWQPYDCDFPRFNATKMLELIRGKRVMFAGDSITRNQWESLLCLLAAAIKDPKRVYETHGRRITKGRGSYSFKFADYECTLEFYVSHYLVYESKARIGEKRKPTLRIDSVDRGSSKWKRADILIFNTANWWSHSKTKAGKNYYQEGTQVHPHLDALTAYRIALTTWATWVDGHINPRKTRIFFRSSAPAHFRGGDWNTGGHCREAKRPLSQTQRDESERDLVAKDVIKQMKTPVTLLNISALSGYRIDAHPSIYGKIPEKRRSSVVEDCSHWCLPGVPDAWNELLYHHLLEQRNSLYAS